jgi:hypothetical protein
MPNIILVSAKATLPVDDGSNRREPHGPRFNVDQCLLGEFPAVKTMATVRAAVRGLSSSTLNFGGLLTPLTRW